MRRKAIGTRAGASAVGTGDAVSARAIAVLAVVVVVAMAIALSGCGSGSGSGSETIAAKADGAGKGAGHGDPRESSCQAQVGDFVHALANLRRRLVAGLTYQQYVSEMRAIRTTYDAVPVARLDLSCLTEVGEPAESGFDTYIDAGNDWGECVGTPGCEAVTVEPVLQRKWRVASKALSEAEHGLAAQPSRS